MTETHSPVTETPGTIAYALSNLLSVAWPTCRIQRLGIGALLSRDEGPWSLTLRDESGADFRITIERDDGAR